MCAFFRRLLSSLIVVLHCTLHVAGQVPVVVAEIHWPVTVVMNRTLQYYLVTFLPESRASTYLFYGGYVYLQVLVQWVGVRFTKEQK